MAIPVSPTRLIVTEIAVLQSEGEHVVSVGSAHLICSNALCIMVADGVGHGDRRSRQDQPDEV